MEEWKFTPQPNHSSDRNLNRNHSLEVEEFKSTTDDNDDEEDNSDDQEESESEATDDISEVETSSFQLNSFTKSIFKATHGPPCI